MTMKMNRGSEYFENNDKNVIKEYSAEIFDFYNSIIDFFPENIFKMDMVALPDEMRVLSIFKNKTY